MKGLFILFGLISLVLSKTNGLECSFEISNEIKSFEECNKLLEDSEDNQCCVGVTASLGKNIYFCETLTKNPSSDEIKKKEEEITNIHRGIYPGTIVRTRINCESDVTPFSFSQCSAEETQVSEKYNDCSKFKKNKNSDYCCLFSAKIKGNDPVYFCEELNETQVKTIDDIQEEIDSNYDMYDVQYMNCTPEIPDDNQAYISYINLKLVSLIYFLLF